MTTFNTADLSPMQLGRLNKALDRIYRFDGGEVKTLRAHLEAEPAIIKSEGDGLIDYSRNHFNSLDRRQQDAYMARLKAKRYYYLSNMQVPKIVYDATRERAADWTGSPCPVDPDNFWIDDATGARIPA
jgi:hypothetical protein